MSDFSREREFLIQISRVTFKEQNIERIEELIKDNKSFDWFYVFAQAFRQKIAALIWVNLNKYKLSGYLPRVISETLRLYSASCKERYELMKNEIRKIEQHFYINNIEIYPLKGAILLSEIYNDGAARISNDMDFMISKRNAKKAFSIMSELSYATGDIDPMTKEVVPYSRERQIMWMTSMDNLPTFYKKIDSIFIDYMIVDFRHSINRSSEVVESIIQNSSKGKLSPIGFLLHLCYHAYDESKQYKSHHSYKDLTLMKFCDIREYTLRYIPTDIWDELLYCAKELNLEDALYFCLTANEFIYNDGYEKQLKGNIKDISEDIMETFGEKEFQETYTFQKKFTDRLFSFSNKDEMNHIPNWLKL